MAEYVLYNPNVHKEEFRKLDTEYYTWQGENPPFDAFAIVGPIETLVNGDIEILSSLKPPEGLFYLLVVDGEVAGMGGLRRLNAEVVRIMWMFIRPSSRGKGFGRQLLNMLLEDGRAFGYSRFQLSPPTFGHVALNLYKSAGFKEIGDSESLLSPLPSVFKPYWIVMEKRD
jgi:GNAT superfamily N-acetyltransferase